MMILLWSTVGASLVVALVAWRQARHTAKRLDAAVRRCTGSSDTSTGSFGCSLQRLTGEGPPPSPETPAAPGPIGESFVPLSSLKR